MFQAARRAADGARDAATLAAEVRAAVEGAGLRVDYVELVHPATLVPVAEAVPGTRLLVAAFLGRTRLIDNLALP
jgi:pantoate--beta-alanine ligase